MLLRLAVLAVSGLALTSCIRSTVAKNTVGHHIIFELPSIKSCNEKPPKIVQGVIEKPSNKQLLLFVHGWNGDSTSTWQRFPDLVCMDPEFLHTDVLSINYPTFMMSKNAGITETASSLQKQLSAIRLNRYKRIAIISHSMGGLVGREMLIADSLSTPKDLVRYKILVEIATPHEGTTELVGLANALGFPGADLLSEVLPGSQFLNDLAAQWNDFRNGRPSTSCFISPQDGVVPVPSARSQCDNYYSFLTGGHRELAKPDGLNDVRYDLPTKAVKEAFSAKARKLPAGPPPPPN
jgi:pimeloyl-ACP methyl ester carboxylesterase